MVCAAKKIGFLIVVAVVVLSAGCRKSVSVPNDLAVMALNGNVKSVESAMFAAEDNDGVPEKIAEEPPYMRTVYNFDCSGRCTAVEKFASETLTAWEERFYDDSGLSAVKMYSVNYGGDRVVEVEYPDSASQIWQVFDETGREIAGRKMKLGREQYNGIGLTASGEPVFYEMMLRRGRVESVKGMFPDHSVLVEYEYDGDGEMSGYTLRNDADGSKTRTYAERLDCDEHRNWTKRSLYSVDEDGVDSLQAVEERTIVYY